MTGPEAGFLLLTSQLGDPERRPLTTTQLRNLASRVRMGPRDSSDRELEERDLLALGYRKEMAERILRLLEDEALMRHYCFRGEQQGCKPLTWATEIYPARLKQHLGEETPGCLWYKGDVSLLKQPMVALVGSRDLQDRNRDFAKEVGFQAAKQGFVLVSGNARGADQVAQHACLQAGGSVISIVADCLDEKRETDHVLYISEDGYDCPFSAQRAISRNRVIHALAEITFVAQAGLYTGGTWDGTCKNLRFGYSPVYCFADGSPAQRLLVDMGADTVTLKQLQDLDALQPNVNTLFDQ